MTGGVRPLPAQISQPDADTSHQGRNSLAKITPPVWGVAMDDLTPSYVPDAGQVILEGRPAGPAGEVGLMPAAGLDLAFDRVDGHLVRVVTDVGDHVLVGARSQAAAALLNRLLGPVAARVLQEVAASPAKPGIAQPHVLSAEPVMCAALSSLARLDAAQETSPVPSRSPWWAAEAAVLAEQAGLNHRAHAEADRLSGVIVSHPSCTPGLDVAAEVAQLEKDPGRRPELNWVLDPSLRPSGLIRPGLSPDSDLLVQYDGAEGRVTVAAALAAGANVADAERCQVRLVNPVVRRVLAQADCQLRESMICAELRLPVPLDELDGAWIEIIEGSHRPVRSAKAYQIRRALRWADAALRAERAPAGLAPRAAAGDWAALAALAWQRCRRDWAAAGDSDRATAQPSPGARAHGPAYLAEILGC